MKAIIVDDEPKAIELIRTYLAHFKGVEVAGTFRNTLKALEFLNKEKIDLVLLDINMPHLSGLSLSRMINPSTKIIFTTAYSEHAVESYEVSAVDYLLKPISFERFTKAINKVLLMQNKMVDENRNILSVKSGAKIFRIDPGDILYLEKDGNYMIYHLDDQQILAREPVAESLGNLPDFFVQVHKSYIVNLNKIDFLDKDEISVGKNIIPIGYSFKAGFLESFNKQ